MDAAVSSFEQLFDVVKEKILDPSARPIPHFYYYGTLARKCQQKAHDPEFRSAIENSVQPLNIEIRRYANKYRELMRYLGEMEDGELVVSILIEGSIYKDVMNKITEAAQSGGIVGEVFDLGI